MFYLKVFNDSIGIEIAFYIKKINNFIQISFYWKKKYRFDNISLKQKISGKIHINNFNAFIFAVN